MPRAVPPPPPRLDRLPPRADPLVEVELRVVTPLFGGGVEAGEVDPLVLVRGASVRGQLRVWWRACNAHRYAWAARLFDDEARLWGAAAVEPAPGTLAAGNVVGTALGPAAIAVAVDLVSAGEPSAAFCPQHYKWEKVT